MTHTTTYGTVMKENVKAFTIAAKHPFTPGSQAGCSDADPALFDPADVTALQAAQAICQTCPVVDLCLQAGLARAEWGVWGGQLLENGVAREEPRRMGRPRKNRAASVPVPA